MKVVDRNILLLLVLLIAAFFAVTLSYYSILETKSNIKASLICKDNTAFLKLANYGDTTKIFYVSITEGDEILFVEKLDVTLRQGDSLLVNLRIPNNRIKVSVLFERGVVSGLRCGITKASEP